MATYGVRRAVPPHPSRASAGGETRADADMMDAFQVHQDVVLYPMVADQVYGHIPTVRYYTRGGAYARIECPASDSVLYHGCSFLRFLKTSREGVLRVYPSSVSVFMANVWFGPPVALAVRRAGAGAAARLVLPGIVSTDARDYEGSTANGLEYVSPHLMRFLGMVFLVSRERKGGKRRPRMVALPPQLYTGPSKVWERATVIDYSTLTKKAVSASVETECKCRAHGKSVGFGSLSDGAGHPIAPFVFEGGVCVCRQCVVNVFCRPPPSWFHVSQLKRMFETEFVSEMIAPLMTPGMRDVLIGSVAWQIVHPETERMYTPSMRMYELMGRAFSASPLELVLRHWIRGSSASRALSGMFGPVVWRACDDLKRIRFNGIARGTPWLGKDEATIFGYFGWYKYAYKKGNGHVPSTKIVPLSKSSLIGKSQLAAIHAGEDIALPQTPYQVLQIYIGVQRQKVVVESAMFLVWVQILRGARLHLVFCAEDYIAPKKRRGIPGPMVVVDAKEEFQPNVDWGRDGVVGTIVVENAHYLDWAGIHWLLTRHGNPLVVLEGSYQTGLRGIDCPYRGKRVGAVFSELAAVISWASLPTDKDDFTDVFASGVGGLTSAPLGVEARPLTVDPDAIRRADVEEELVKTGPLDVAAAVKGRLPLDPAWQVAGLHLFVFVLYYLEAPLPEKIWTAFQREDVPSRQVFFATRGEVHSQFVQTTPAETTPDRSERPAHHAAETTPLPDDNPAGLKRARLDAV